MVHVSSIIRHPPVVFVYSVFTGYSPRASSVGALLSCTQAAALSSRAQDHNARHEDHRTQQQGGAGSHHITRTALLPCSSNTMFGATPLEQQFGSQGTQQRQHIACRTCRASLKQCRLRVLWRVCPWEWRSVLLWRMPKGGRTWKTEIPPTESSAHTQCLDGESGGSYVCARAERKICLGEAKGGGGGEEG